VKTTNSYAIVRVNRLSYEQSSRTSRGRNQYHVTILAVAYFFITWSQSVVKTQIVSADMNTRSACIRHRVRSWGLGRGPCERATCLIPDESREIPLEVDTWWGGSTCTKDRIA